MPNISDYVRHNNTVILGEAVATSIFNVLSTKKSSGDEGNRTLVLNTLQCFLHV